MRLLFSRSFHNNSDNNNNNDNNNNRSNNNSSRYHYHYHHHYIITLSSSSSHLRLHDVTSGAAAVEIKSLLILCLSLGSPRSLKDAEGQPDQHQHREHIGGAVADAAAVCMADAVYG